jgi:hypothetical protein
MQQPVAVESFLHFFFTVEGKHMNLLCFGSIHIHFCWLSVSRMCKRTLVPHPHFHARILAAGYIILRFLLARQKQVPPILLEI